MSKYLLLKLKSESKSETNSSKALASWEKKQERVRGSFGYKKAWHGWQYKFRTFLKRAYDSRTLEKLREFLTVESLEFHPEAI